MKKIIIIAILTLAAIIYSKKNFAQANELAQLALNIEKLAQFRQILSDLKKGYEILFGGYTTIRNISKGNFDLHKLFLDGLLEVSPAVKNYKRVPEIINYQLQLVKEYKKAFKQFRGNGWFNTVEIDYMGKVYGNLFKLSLKNLDDLLTVTTAKKLRMNDEERLAAIDKIYEDMQDKLVFLRSFNNSTSILGLQRQREKAETNSVQGLYNLR